MFLVYSKDMLLSLCYFDYMLTIFQLIKDMVSVSEATDWSVRSGVQSKYKALRCTIEHVASTEGLYKKLKNKCLSSLVALSREE